MIFWFSVCLLLNQDKFGPIFLYFLRARVPISANVSGMSKHTGIRIERPKKEVNHKCSIVKNISPSFYVMSKL